MEIVKLSEFGFVTLMDFLDLRMKLYFQNLNSKILGHFLKKIKNTNSKIHQSHESKFRQCRLVKVAQTQKMPTNQNLQAFFNNQ